MKQTFTPNDVSLLNKVAQKLETRIQSALSISSSVNPSLESMQSILSEFNIDEFDQDTFTNFLDSVSKISEWYQLGKAVNLTAMEINKSLQHQNDDEPHSASFKNKVFH